MNSIYKYLITSIFLISMTANAAYVVRADITQAELKSTTRESMIPVEMNPETPTTKTISITKNFFNPAIGTYTVTDDELDMTSILYSKEGCILELEGTSTSGTYDYINDQGCSDYDTFTLSTLSGYSQEFEIWNDGGRCTDNDWLNAARNGFDGLVYNHLKCNIDSSFIKVLGSFDDIPGTYLLGVDIDLYDGTEGTEGEGEMEGQDYYNFNLPDVRYIKYNIEIKHPFISEFDFSRLEYAGYSSPNGLKIVITDNAFVEEIDLRSLRSSPTLLDFSYNFALEKLDIRSVQYAGTIDISETSITDISSFYNLRQGNIVSNGTTFTYFPSRNSSFCYGFRRGDISITPESNALSASYVCR